MPPHAVRTCASAAVAAIDRPVAARSDAEVDSTPPSHESGSERKRTRKSGAAQRDGAKEAEGEKDGLLVGRHDFQRDYGALVTGDRTHCLADAVAHALDADHLTVRAGIGANHSFARAIAYVNEAHPEKALVKVTASLMVKGGVELALLNRPAGRLILAMSYTLDGAKKYHCAFFDAGFEWTRETLDRGWVRGHGVLKDNQANVLPYLAEPLDRASKEAAREFFQEPYALQMRIEAVYELAGGARAAAVRRREAAQVRGAVHDPVRHAARREWVNALPAGRVFLSVLRRRGHNLRGRHLRLHARAGGRRLRRCPRRPHRGDAPAGREPCLLER